MLNIMESTKLFTTSISKQKSVKKSHDESFQHYLNILKTIKLIHTSIRTKQYDSSTNEDILTARLRKLTAGLESKRNHCVNLLKEYLELEEQILLMEARYGLDRSQYKLMTDSSNKTLDDLSSPKIQVADSMADIDEG